MLLLLCYLVILLALLLLFEVLFFCFFFLKRSETEMCNWLIIPLSNFSSTLYLKLLDDWDQYRSPDFVDNDASRDVDAGIFTPQLLQVNFRYVKRVTE